MSQLKTLMKKYRTALYTYFRVLNLPDAYEEFLADPSKPPVFEYAKSVNYASISKRLKSLQDELKKYSGKDVQIEQFLKYRILETEILALFCLMLEDPKKRTKKNLNLYVDLQKALYGEVDEKLFKGILSTLNGKSEKLGLKTPQITKATKTAGAENAKLYKPKNKTFLYYKNNLGKLWPELHQVLDSAPDNSHLDISIIEGLFGQSLVAVGADQHGWEVEVSPKGANVVVSKHRQRVLLSSHLKPRTLFRLKQVIVHEVGGHVSRSLGVEAISEASEEEEEGLAIMLEQLLSKRFIYKRTMRYLALCVALGLDGKKRNFNDTYGFMKEAFSVICEDKDEACRRAFYETARIFRGGFTDEPGLVYIKDKVYLESNLKIWQQMEEDMLEEEHFISVFQPNLSTIKPKEEL